MRINTRNKNKNRKLEYLGDDLGELRKLVSDYDSCLFHFLVFFLDQVPTLCTEVSSFPLQLLHFSSFPRLFSLINVVLNVHRNHKAYYGRGEGGKRGMEVGGEGDYIPIATLSPPPE